MALFLFSSGLWWNSELVYLVLTEIKKKPNTKCKVPHRNVCVDSQSAAENKIFIDSERHPGSMVTVNGGRAA